MVSKIRSTPGRSRSIKTKAPKESNYQHKLLKKLRAIPNSYFFSKEAGAIRGISDIIGVVNGRAVFLEAKKSLEEFMKYHPRTALQKKFLMDTKKAGSISYFIYPENEEEILEELWTLSTRAQENVPDAK